MARGKASTSKGRSAGNTRKTSRTVGGVASSSARGGDNDSSDEELPDVSTLRKSASSTQVQRDSAGDEESNADSSDEDVQRATNKHAKGHGGTRLASKPFTARQLQAAAAHAPSLKTNTHDGSAGNARAGAHGRGTKHQRQVEDSGNFSFLTEANGSKRARLAELSDSDESDSAGTGTVPRVRSESVRGYTWDVERLSLRPEDLGGRLTYHMELTDVSNKDGKTRKCKVGDQVFVAPDPTTLPPHEDEITLEDLDDDEFWVAEVVACCALDNEAEDGTALGVLKIAWMYAPDHARKLGTLHEQYKRDMSKYRFDEDELIMSDHYDFLSLDTVCGRADHIYCYLRLTGLAVKDAERVGPLDKRSKQVKPKTTKLVGFKKKMLEDKQIKNGTWKEPTPTKMKDEGFSRAAKKPSQAKAKSKK